MNNKRNLKRTINLVCSDLFAEVVAHSLHHGKPDKETAEALLASIIVIHSDFIKRISHPEPGMKPKEYYDFLVKDFNKHVEEVVDQINNFA